MSDVTRILTAIEGGDRMAADELLAAVYAELRVLAAQMLSRERPGQTLQATALVHEAYVRLVGSEDAGWQGRRHFFGAAAEAMRRILVDNRNNHPHPAGSGWLVHNGVVHNHQHLARNHGLDLQSQCDSEVLGLLMARCAGSIVRRCAWAANQAQGDLAMLGVWRSPARLLVSRRGRPLCFGRSRAGFYFASLPDGLPGRAQTVADRSARILIYQDGALRLDGDAIRLAAGG